MSNVDETVVAHHDCEQWFIQSIIFPWLFIPRLTPDIVARIVSEDKPAVIPHHVCSHGKYKYELMPTPKCPVHVLTPRSGSEEVCVFYFHGGAYIRNFESPAHFDFAINVGESIGKAATLYLIEYPRAPAYRHDALFDAMEEVYRTVLALAKWDAPGKKVVLMGDSSGGGIALLLAQRLTRLKKLYASHLKQPDSVILLSPWLDLGVSAPKEESEALMLKDPILDVAGLRACGRLLAGGHQAVELGDSKVSPLFGNLEGLPPVSVWTGTHDVLHPDSRRLRDRYRQTNWEGPPSRLRYREKGGLLHCFFLFPGSGTFQTIQEIGEAIRVNCGLTKT